MPKHDADTDTMLELHGRGLTDRAISKEPNARSSPH